MYTRALLFVFLGLLSTLAGAQNGQAEFHSMRYIGFGSQINPSVSSLSSNPVSVRLAGFSMFMDNNYLFVEETQPGDRLEWNQMTMGETTYQLTDDYSQTRKWGYVNTRISGPSIQINFGSFNAGLFYNNRTVIEVEDMPAHLAKNIYEGFEFNPLIGRRLAEEADFFMKALNWSEVGLNFSMRTKSRNRSIWSFGGNVKYLNGHANSNVIVDYLDYTVVDSINMVTHNADVQISNAMDMGMNNPGFGLDFGFTYVKLQDNERNTAWLSGRGSACRPMNYKYRIGASITDLGMIRFDNAYYREIQSNSDVVLDRLQIMGIQSLDELNAILDQNFSSDFTNRSESFTVYTPAQINIHGDAHLISNFYFGGGLSTPLFNGNTTVQLRPQIYAIPRFEVSWFEFALPVTVFDMQKPLVGFKMRLWGLVVGSDNLGFLTPGKIYEGSFYAGLHFAFPSNDCNSGRSRRSKTPIFERCNFF